MSISLEISQEIEIRVDWEKLAYELKEKFNIDTSQEVLEEFFCENEQKFLTTESYEPEIEEDRTNDLTGNTVVTD